VLVAVLGGISAFASVAAAQQPVQGAPQAIDGPSPDIVQPSGLGLSVARDSSGGLIYLKRVNGTPHVFVSSLSAGGFSAPTEIDAGLGGASSQPVIAAGNGGLLLIGFINGGELYAVQRANQTAAFSTPTGLAGGASNPSISITNFPKAYLAFTVGAGVGSDVRTAYWNKGKWALEGPALNASPSDNAGTGGGRPDVTAAGDGIATVVWGENGHVYARRVWGTAPSVVDEQADAAPGGCTESSADEPSVSAGGDSSYAAVAFRENVTCGGHQQSRVFSNRLQASTFDGITNADGLSGAPADGAQDPQVSATEYGAGWITSERTVSDGVYAQWLNQNTRPAGVSQINTLPITTLPDPVPATAGLYSTFIAWQQEPGAAGPSEIRVRFAPTAAGTLGPEMVLSSPAQGPVDAADGIAAAGDVYGEAAVAWLQGAPGSSTVMVDQMFQSPGSFQASSPVKYARTAQPSFAWTAPHGWGPMQYTLTVDGAALTQTSAQSAAAPVPLRDGRHSWQVLASNPVGQQSETKLASVFIDTVPPRAKMRLAKLAQAGSKLAASVTYSDSPPRGQPRSAASGVAKVLIRWGDRKSTQLKLGSHLTTHVYRRTGRYRITITVTDKAGNVTRLSATVKVERTLPKHVSMQTVSSKAPPSSTTGGATSPAKRTRARRAKRPAIRTGSGPTGPTASKAQTASTTAKRR
jgi:hypothetical protein